MKFENKDGHAAHIEYSGFSGSVLTVDGGMIKGAALPTGAGTRKAVQGWACVFNKPHEFKGGIDVFAPGAFDETLAARDTVEFRVTHDGSAVATTDDRLELVSDRKGLAFRLRLDGGTEGVAEIVADRKMDAISPGYRVLESEMKSVDGDEYRLIKKAALTEISLVRRGAVRQTFAHLVDAVEVAPLATEMKGAGFAAESAFARLMRTLEDTE